jgi:lipopolysaccharide assembly protein A
MAFLRTLFWIMITAIVVVFSIRNWVPVTISLFGDIDADVKLPVLLLIAFLAGFVPLYVWHRAVRWRHGRQLAAAERAVPPPPVVSSLAPLAPQPSPVVTPAAETPQTD